MILVIKRSPKTRERLKAACKLPVDSKAEALKNAQNGAKDIHNCHKLSASAFTLYNFSLWLKKLANKNKQ